MTYAWWPLFDLRLTAPDVTLRPMREADLAAIAGLLPGDVEQDPGATRYSVGDGQLSRGIIAHQSYWAAGITVSGFDGCLPLFGLAAG